MNKHWLAMLVVGTTLYLSTESATIIHIPPDTQFIMDPSTPTVCPEVPPCVCAGMVVSTGPFILRAASGPDCYLLPYVNPNGTPSKSPLDWIACPK